MALPAPISDQEIADKLTRSGLHWNQTTIEYSFNNLSTSGNTLDANQISWIEKAIDIIEDSFGLTFNLVSSGADITINGSSGNGTYASTSYYSDRHIAGSNIFFDQSWGSNQSANLDYGSYGFTTIIHEFMHSLGLSHPGSYNAGSGGSITYANSAEFEQDTHRYSVMSYFNSYFDGSGSYFFDITTGASIYPQTPMVYDIFAMTNGSFNGYFPSYSANATTRNTDTSYGYNATSGLNEVYNFTVNGAPVLTIYDTGGTDTLDLSGDTIATTRTINYDANDNPVSYSSSTRTDTLIDIREGEYSSTHGMTYNIGIAIGTVIENVVGTQFNDTIYGNDVGNILDGGSSGVDTIIAGAGDDILIGGTGADVLDGGDDIDTASYARAGSGVTLNLLYGTGTVGDAMGDTLTNIENVTGSDFSDIIWGDNGNNVILGMDGNDILSGGAGIDTIEGGDGEDRLYGNGGDDILRGGESRDSIEGGAGADTIDGGSTGDDRDIAEYYNSQLGVTVDLLNGIATGGDAQGDTLIDIEWLGGGVNADFLYGDGERNYLFGRAGNDELYGRANRDWIDAADGDDFIEGGTGSDGMLGGQGLDVFKFSSGDGYDVIWQFNISDDKIDLSSFGLSTKAQALAMVADNGAHVRIPLGGSDYVNMLYLDHTLLTEDNFIIV